MNYKIHVPEQEFDMNGDSEADVLKELMRVIKVEIEVVGFYGNTVTGTIRKVISHQKGYFGKKDFFFITGEDGNDYFAGINEVVNIPEDKKPLYVYKGNRVRFTTAAPLEGEKGARAVNIIVTKKAQLEQDGHIYREVKI